DLFLNSVSKVGVFRVAAKVFERQNCDRAHGIGHCAGRRCWRLCDPTFLKPATGRSRQQNCSDDYKYGENCSVEIPTTTRTNSDIYVSGLPSRGGESRRRMLGGRRCPVEASCYIL